MTRRTLLGAVLAAAALVAGQSCTVHDSEAPSLTGPSTLQSPLGPAGPVARFTFTPDKPTANLPVAFDGRSSCPEGGFTNGCITTDRTITTFIWDFGDGTTDSGPTVSHAFKSTGSFNVTLSVVSDRGLGSSVSKGVQIEPGTPPKADFVFSPATPGVGQNVSFNAAQSTAAQGHNIASYSWDFGDGAKGTGINPSHAYVSAGGYNVVLTVTDEVGQTAAAAKSVPVTASSGPGIPTPDFVFSPTDPSAGQSVLFNATQSKAAAGHSIVSFDWNFGDGATGSGVTATRAFASAGTYSIVLVVTDDLGQKAALSKTVTVKTTSTTPPPTADFVFSPTNPTIAQSVVFNGSQSKAASGHTITSYAWNFGDGTAPGSGVTPSHSFSTAATFTVVLTVTDELGQTGVASKTITVGTTSQTPAPTADFVFSPTNPAIAQSVSFNASASKAATGHTITSYNWNFGDGTPPTTGVTVSHPFSVANTFSVVLGVTDDLGQTTVVSKTITVSANNSTPPPTADFVFSPTNPAAGQSVSFNATTSKAAAGHSITTYNWNFGDTGTATGATPTHTFATAATFSVVLTVIDDLGQSATVAKTVSVSGTSPSDPPKASFVFSPAQPALGDTVSFDARASSAAAGRTIVSYKWTFGDNTGTFTFASPTAATHVYSPSSGAGTYNVVLVVVDDLGKEGTTSVGVPVGNAPAPTAKFTFSPTNPVVGDTVVFDTAGTTTAQGQTVAKYDWNFGDGTPITTCHVPPQGGDAAACTGGTNRTISHVFNSAASFSVNLVVTDTAGRTGSISAVVSVSSPNPTARLTLTKTGGTSIQADGSTSSATGTATIVTYSFNWGDGSPSTVGSTPIVPHTYSVPGTYTVVLTVTDNHSPTPFSGTTSQQITVP